MAEDRHFGTGEYDPRRYWTARAERGGGDLWQTVCGYGLSAARNRAMDRMQRRLLASALGRLDGRAVLDFGCGAGRLSGWLADRSARYTGTDLSAEMLSLARQRHPVLDYKRLENGRLPFAGDSFDVAVSVTVLHHNPYERQEQLIGELLRVLRPGGLLCLLERTGSRRGPGTLFTLYPRPLSDWIAGVTAGGRATLVRCRPARWWILADALALVARRLGRPPSPALDESLSSWGERIDPMLLPLLPARWATSAAMSFRKVGRDETRLEDYDVTGGTLPRDLRVVGDFTGPGAASAVSFATKGPGRRPDR